MSAGYPDFRRRTDFQTDELVNQPALVFTSVATIGPVFCGSSNSLLLAFTPGAAKTQLNVSFYADQALSFFIGAQTFVVNTGRSAFIQVPCRGSFVVFGLSVLSGAAQAASLYVAGTARVFPQSSFPTEHAGIHTTGLSVAGLTTVTLEAVGYFYGDAQWSMTTTGANYSVELQKVNYDGTIERISNWTQVVLSEVSELVLIPPGHIRVSITNGGAVAQTFSIALTPRFV